MNWTTATSRASTFPGDAAESAAHRRHRLLHRRLTSRDLTVTVEGDDPFRRLAPVWNRLLRESGADTVFLSWEWLEAWWRSYRRRLDGEPLVLTARDRRGNVVGIAPLLKTTEWLGPGDGDAPPGVPIRTLRILGEGTWDSDDLDWIVRRGDERPVTLAILRHLAGRRDWDVLRLAPVREDSPTWPILVRAARSLGWRIRDERRGCAHSVLPASWDDFLSSLSSRFRTRVRSSLRKVIDEGDCEVRVCRSWSELGPTLDRLFALHEKRWSEIDDGGSFDVADRRTFYREFAPRAMRRDWLRIYSLVLDGETIAVQIGVVYDGVLYHLQEGWDPDHASISPGVALRAWVLRDCIAEGLKGYDNLLGIPRHKLRWGAEPRWVHFSRLARPGLRGWIALRMPEHMRTIRDRGVAALDGIRGGLRDLGSAVGWTATGDGGEG